VPSQVLTLRKDLSGGVSILLRPCRRSYDLRREMAWETWFESAPSAAVWADRSSVGDIVEGEQSGKIGGSVSYLSGNHAGWADISLTDRTPRLDARFVELGVDGCSGSGPTGIKSQDFVGQAEIVAQMKAQSSLAEVDAIRLWTRQRSRPPALGSMMAMG
jgi:hypothetical protein